MPYTALRAVIAYQSYGLDKKDRFQTAFFGSVITAEARGVSAKVSLAAVRDWRHGYAAGKLGAKALKRQPRKLGSKNKRSTARADLLFLERITGLEPATSTLARWRSTK